MQSVTIAAFVLLGVIVILDIYLIYCAFSSRFMKYPPLVVSTGDVRSTLIRRVGKRIRKCEANDFKMPFKIVDAGCGIGTLIVPLAREFPQHNFVGIEWSLMPYLISKVRARNLPNLQIIRQDMFEYDFSSVNIVVCFLLKSLMPRFTSKICGEFGKKSYVFSNRFPLNNCEAIEQVDFNDHFSYLHLYKFLPQEKKQGGICPGNIPQSEL